MHPKAGQNTLFRPFSTYFVDFRCPFFSKKKSSPSWVWVSTSFKELELELELEWFIFHRKYGHLHLRKIICHLG